MGSTEITIPVPAGVKITTIMGEVDGGGTYLFHISPFPPLGPMTGVVEPGKPLVIRLEARVDKSSLGV